MEHYKSTIIWTPAAIVDRVNYFDHLAVDQKARFNFTHWPLTKSHPLSNSEVIAQLPSFEPDFLVMTSRLSVSLVNSFPRLVFLKQKKVPVYTFGQRTYQALIESGWKAILLNHALSGQQFAEHLRKNLPPSKVWYFAATSPAFDISGHLNAHSWNASSIGLYKTSILEESLLRQQVNRSVLTDHLIVCMASPLAVKAFVKVVWPLLKSKGFDLPQVNFVSIGPTTSKALRSFFTEKQAVITASSSSMKSLIASALSLVH